MADPWSAQIDRLNNVAQETKENDATKKSDDPWQFEVDRRLQAKRNRLQNEVHNASQQNAQDANDLTKLSKQTGLSPDIVASNKQEIQQTVKAQDIAQKVDNMQEPERDYLVQNQRIAPLQDDLDKVENLTRVTREKKWYDQNYFERNFLNPILSGARSAQQGFNVNQLRDSIDQVNTLNFLIGQDQNLDRSELLKIAQDNGINVGLVGAFAGRDRAELDARLRVEREAVQSSVADLIEATKAKKDLPLDPNIDTRGGFWETLSRTITENPGAAWRLTAESIIQQTPALAAGLFTRGLGATATGANVFGGSFLTEEPAQVIELLQEEGHDLTNPDTIIEVFTDHALMEEVQDKARRKAIATATVETMFMGLATLPIAPKSIGGTQLTNAQRELADKTINVPIQAFGEGAGEAAGQLARDGEIDFGEVALETLAGGVTGPVEVFVYGAGEYRRSRRDRQYLESLRDAIADTDGTNIDDGDIRELVSRAKENGPIQEMYVDVGEFDQLLQSQNIDPDEFLESSPLIAEQYYEAQITGGDVIFQLEDFASLIAKTELADGFIDISRTDQAGFSPSEANAWLENEAKPAVEEALAFDPATERVPVDQIQNDITGQLIDLGYAQTAAETTAEFTATMFARIAHITGQDPVQLYQQYGLQFIREQTEAQREVRQVTGLDNLIDRIRAGEVPTQQQQFGQSLVQFLREQGGVADEAGELAAIDPDAERPTFDRALIQDAGIPLDTARERAVEAGFLPENADINDLLDAIDRETRGEAIFSEQFLQPDQVQLARDATLLEEELARQGLDVQQMTNEEIIQALDELIADQQPSEALQQQREESVPERSDRVLTSRDINGFDTKSNGDGIVFQETGVLEVPEADIGDLTPEQEAALELIDLGHVAWVDTDANDLVTYDIYSDGVLAGETTVQRNRETGDIVALHDIKIEQKGRGVGERAVSALLASVDDELFIVEAITSAQPFWSAMGASGFFDPNNNVRISWDGYTENKRRGRGGAFWTRALQEGDAREQDAQDGDATGQTGVSRGEGPVEGDEPTAVGVVDLSDLNEQDLELEENWFESLQPDALAQSLTDRIDELRQPVEPDQLFQDEDISIDEANQERQQAFDRWAGGNQLIEDPQDHIFVPGEPVVVKSFHGTTHDFDRIDPSIGNPENDLGRGFYTSSSESDVEGNYGADGPDLTARIEQRKEQLEWEVEDNPGQFGFTEQQVEEDIDAVVEQIARRELVGTFEEGQVLELYVKMDNPFIIDRAGQAEQTRIDFEGEVELDEDGDVISEEPSEAAATVFDFIEDKRNEGFDINDDALSQLQEMTFDGQVDAIDLVDALKEVFQFSEDPETGQLVGNDFVGDLIGDLGFDGIVYQDASAHFERMDIDPGTKHFIVWEPTNVKSVESVGFSPDDPRLLFQERRRGTGTRGAFFFDALDRAVIQLGDAADLTTVPHEVYHLSLDIINDQAQDSPELQQELELIRNWYAENSESLKDEAIQEAEKAGDKSAATSIKMMDDEAVKEFYQSRDLSLRSLPKEGTDRFLSIAGLEQFARAGEAYLLEGNAPKVELSGIFRRMKNWFIQVYNTARRLNVNLTDEMRGFFNRLIATENEIQAARDLASYGSTLADVEGLNWTDEEREQVARLNGQARDQAEAQLIKEQVRDMEKTQQAWWETESEKARKKIFDEINTLPEYQARAMFTMGKRPDGSPLPEGVEQIKLNKQMLVDEFGAEFLKRLPSPRNTDNKAPQYVYSNEGGVDPRVAARTYGFTSARDLVEALIDSRPINAYVDSLVNLEMRNNFPDINLSGEVQELAKQAVYNDKQAQLMLAELKKLEQVAGTNPVIPQLFRQKAEQMVAMKSSRELRPDLFARTAAKFGREALRASIEGNFQDALVAKQKQLINHHMYKAAVKARDSAEAVFRRAKRLQGTKTQERIGKAGGEYLERINEILTKYEFRRVTLKELDRRSSLRDWMDKKRENGEHVDIPEEVIERARRTNWREVPIEELEAVNDALKNLEHISRVKNKLLASKEERELQEVVDSVIERLEKTQGKKKGKAFFEQKRLVEKLREAGQDYASIALNIDSIIRELDGFEDLGPVYDAIKRPIDEAARNRLPELQEEFGQKLDDIYNRHFTRQEQRQFTEKNWVELPGRGFLSREEALAVALNWGNEHNREAVLTGIASGQDRITPEDARVILDSLTKADWDFAQNIWDLLDDEMWPMVRDAQKRRTGLAPEKVEASPIQTKFGVYRGGYYPVKFDRSLGWRVTAQEAEQMAQEVRMGGFAQAQTKRGFTKARTNSAQQPVKLDLSVIHTHMDEVLTDLALGDAINDVARIVNHKDFIQEMERTGNAWVVRTLDNWLKDAAAQEVLAGDILSRWARKIRVGFTVSKLAWNIGTIALQPTGLLQSLPAVGYRNMWDAISQVSKAEWQGPNNIVAQVRDRSAFMRTRGAGFNKDIQITLNALKGPGFVESILERVPWVRNMAQGTGPQKAAEFFFNSFMGGIVAVQQVVDTIVWLGAYNKVKNTMSDVDAVQFADNTVARTQASAIFTDRTAFERGSLSQNTRQSEFVRLWTVLGSYMFAKANIAYEQTKKTSFRDPNQIARWMHDMFLLFVAEAIFIGLLRNTIPDEEDEDETVLGFLGKESLNSLLSGMPIVRDGASALNGFQGGGALGGFWQEVGKLGTQVSQGELDAPLVKSLNNVGGVMFKYPSGQINRFFDTLWKDLDGGDVDTIDYLLWRKQ